MLAPLIIFWLIVLTLNLNKNVKGSTVENGKKAVQIIGPLKYLSNF